MGCCGVSEENNNESDKVNDKNIEVNENFSYNEEKKKSSWKAWLVLIIIFLFAFGYIM